MPTVTRELLKRARWAGRRWSSREASGWYSQGTEAAEKGSQRIKGNYWASRQRPLEAVRHCGHLAAIKFEAKVAYNVTKYQGAYRVAINQKFSAKKQMQADSHQKEVPNQRFSEKKNKTTTTKKLVLFFFF